MCRDAPYESFELGDRVVLSTHSQELEAFEALAWDDRDQLHFAKEADFAGREPGR